MSEYWIRQEVRPAPKARLRLYRPGSDFFDFVKYDRNVQTRASLRSQGFELPTNLINFDNLESVTPESD